jgi:hypothetical protein
MDELQLTGQRQAIWSKTANNLKARYTRARRWTFLFTIFGALFSMVASQLKVGTPRLWLAGLSTLLFALVSFVSARMLGQDRATAWVRARAAAEALKREGYKYSASAAPYDREDRAALLHSERGRIEQDLDDLLHEAVSDARAGSVPVSDLAPADYVEQRIDRQIKEFFAPNANTAQRKARLFRRTEFALSIAAAGITAIVGVAGKTPVVHFDFMALAAVLTTISGTILAHVGAERYDYTASQYRATIRRLQDALAGAPTTFTSPSPDWSAFVEKCESILSDENNSWVAKWSKPARSGP